MGTLRVNGTVDANVVKGIVSIPYAICDTPAGNATKTVTLENFVVETGATIVIKFTYENTSTTNLTLSVNGTTPRSIYYNGARAPLDLIKQNNLYAFVYYNSHWNLVNSYFEKGVKEWSTTENAVAGTTPIGAALASELNANRIAYLNPDCILIEKSIDSGTTWTEANYSDVKKSELVTVEHDVSIGESKSAAITYRTRIVLTAQDSSAQYLYTRARKLLIKVADKGHSANVLVERKKNGGSWESIGTYVVDGYPDWNEISLDGFKFGGSSGYWQIRLTFAITAVDSTNASTHDFVIKALRLYGDADWYVSNNMAKTGHLYSYDGSQNCTFPGDVHADHFYGIASVALRDEYDNRIASHYATKEELARLLPGVVVTQQDDTITFA